MAKSIVITYLFWIFGGWFGLHHLYLERDRQAFVWWCLVAGCGGLGWFCDLFKIPRYVEEANFDTNYVEKFTEKMNAKPKPPFSLYRFVGQITFGNLLSWVIYAAIPAEVVIPGYSLRWLVVLVPLGSALGVHVVGNIGKEEGSIRNTLIGDFLPLVFYTAVNPQYYWSSVLGAFAFRTQVKWRRLPPKKRNFFRRVSTLSACAFIYLSLWSSYLYFNMVITNEHGETIKFRDSVKNLLNSPMFQELRESLRTLWHYYKIHGWTTLWSEVMSGLDPMGERSALRTLELPSGSSQEEITQKWRQLSRKWHPDKFQVPAEKPEAQTKFIKFREAYDKLSTIHIQRKQKNSRSRTREEESQNSEEVITDRVEL